jgi:hypothetical protein
MYFDSVKKFISTHHLLLRKFSDKQILEFNEELSQKIFTEEKEKNDVLCGICKYNISSIDDMIEVNGSHQHTFKNPVGIVYRIRCFSSASGCMLIGAPTTDNTWFPEFSWNFSLCSQCFSHLGWFYQSVQMTFFGLILENIIENSSIH